MANISVKVLKDKNEVAFVPFTITDAVFEADTDKTLKDIMQEQKDYVDDAVEHVDDIAETIPTQAQKDAWDAKYDKPVAGIPKTDLEPAVQTSLGKADTALQSETDPVFAASTAASITATDVTNWNNKVEDANYTHTDNNYTTNEKNKLAGIASGAEVNVLEKVKVNGTEQTITSKAVDISVPTKVSDINNDLSFIDNTVNNLVNYYTKTEVDTKVSSVYKYKGSVNTYSDLPSSGQVIGDVYNVVTADTTHGIPAGGNVAWNGTTWDNLGGEVDLSNYYTKSQVDTNLNTKVDKVTGKQLSTEDYTSAEKTKLSGIEAGAEVNDIDTIKVNGTAQSITNKTVDITVPTLTDSLNVWNSNIAASSKTVYNLNTSKYEKPSGGIPSTDLDSTVQTSLGKANTALQSFTESDPVFSASAAAGITTTDITNWNAKLDHFNPTDVTSTISQCTLYQDQLLGYYNYGTTQTPNYRWIKKDPTFAFKGYWGRSSGGSQTANIGISTKKFDLREIDERHIYVVRLLTPIRPGDTSQIFYLTYSGGNYNLTIDDCISDIYFSFVENVYPEYNSEGRYFGSIYYLTSKGPRYIVIYNNSTNSGIDVITYDVMKNYITGLTGYSSTTANQFLTHDTSGNLMWTTISNGNGVSY